MRHPILVRPGLRGAGRPPGPNHRVPETVRTCTDCARALPIEAFTPDATSRNGFKTICVECDRACQRLRRRYRKFMAAACDICGQTHSLVVDHDHETGAFRGTLCNGCNRIVGILDRNPGLIGRARQYLRRS